MWIQRDFLSNLDGVLPVKVLTGPRQVGKTSLLSRMKEYKAIYLDDPAYRSVIQNDPKAFLNQQPNKLILDEAVLAPNLFPELKRRVDEQRRKGKVDLDYWITGSNQTLMRKNIAESLAGRASFFELNTLSVHELGGLSLEEHCIRGGWPELRAHQNVEPIRYLNDLMVSFVEKDIAYAAGIEKTGAFQLVLQLNSGRIGQLYVASEVSKAASVDITTVQSWNQLLQQNNLISLVRPYFSNTNKRIVKTPKLFFQDVALAVRLQGWSEFSPLFVSPYMGHVFENLVFTELNRTYINKGRQSKVFYLRSKEKVEIDFLIELPNKKFIAIESKMTPQEFTKEQLKLLDSLNVQIVEKLVVSNDPDLPLSTARNISVLQIWEVLGSYL